jgi:hypothetical protein
MILTLDNLASRYHCLPSEALARASTFDLHVLDVSARWSNRQQEKTSGNKSAANLSQQEMMDMINRTKQQAKGD